MEKSLPYLERADADYGMIEMKQAQLDVQYVMAVVYHNLGMHAKRDEITTQYLALEEEHKQIAARNIEPWYEDVWRVVSEVGAALAAR